MTHTETRKLPEKPIGLVHAPRAHPCTNRLGFARPAAPTEEMRKNPATERVGKGNERYSVATSMPSARLQLIIVYTPCSEAPPLPRCPPHGHGRRKFGRTCKEKSIANNEYCPKYRIRALGISHLSIYGCIYIAYTAVQFVFLFFHCWGAGDPKAYNGCPRDLTTL